jgi:hypothetical protein
MRRLNYTIENTIAYHGTNTAGVEGIAKIQNRKSVQISTASSKHMRNLLSIISGVETTGGVLLQLQGDVSISFKRDAFTERTRGGRRSTLMSTKSRTSDFTSSFENDTISKLSREMGEELQSMMVVIAERIFSKLFDDIFRRDIEDQSKQQYEHLRNAVDTLNWGFSRKDADMIFGDQPGRKSSEMSLQKLVRLIKDRNLKDPVSVKIRKGAGQFVREYMDYMEKLMSEDKYREMFVIASNLEDKSTSDYDEHIMGNFTIIGVAFSKMTGATSGLYHDLSLDMLDTIGKSNDSQPNSPYSNIEYAVDVMKDRFRGYFGGSQSLIDAIFSDVDKLKEFSKERTINELELYIKNIVEEWTRKVVGRRVHISYRTKDESIERKINDLVKKVPDRDNIHNRLALRSK